MAGIILCHMLDASLDRTLKDLQTAPRQTDVNNTGYNQPNDPHIITTGFYGVDQQPQSGTQPQSPGRQTPNYGQQPPNYGQQPPIDGQQPQSYGQQPPNNRQQPQTYEQQEPNDGQQPQNYGQQPQNYTPVFSMIPSNHHPKVPTIQQPMNMRSNNTDSGRSDLLCPAICVCLCCFWPTGIAAIIYASKAADAYKFGNIADGQRYHRKSRTLIGVTVFVGILWGAFCFMLTAMIRRYGQSLRLAEMYET